MPILSVQRLIYRNLFQRPRVNRALERFGNALNKVGLPYATGLTRNKSVLFTAKDQNEVDRAKEDLWATNISRARWAVEDKVRAEFGLPQRTRLERFQHFMFDVKPGDPACMVVGMGVGGETNGNSLAALMKKHGSLKAIHGSLEAMKELNKLGKTVIRDEGGYKLADISGLSRSPLLKKLEKIIAPMFKGVSIGLSEAESQFLEGMPRLQKIITGSKFKKSHIRKDFIEPIIAAATSAKITGDQIVDLSKQIAEKCGENACKVFACLPAALEVAEHIFTPGQIVHRFGRMVEIAKKDSPKAFLSFCALFGNLSFIDVSTGDMAVTRFFTMLESLTDHNRERVLSLLDEHNELYASIGQANFLPHFNLYMDILTSHKRLGLALLEGILEATEKEIIPKELTHEEVVSINSFVGQTHGFSPIVYKVYQDKGDALILELQPLADKVLADSIGKDEIESIIKKYQSYDGLEFLAAIIQMAIPLSGASFIKRGEAKNLLRKMIGAGDLRGQVPSTLRDKARNILLDSSDHALKEGEEISLKIINPILDGLRNEVKAEEAELVGALEMHLKSKDENKEDKINKVRQVLYRYASRRDLLGEKIDRLGSTDYYTLRLLEEIFRDKDSLASLLVRAIDKLPPALLAAEKARIIHPIALVKALNNMWRGKGSIDEKKKRLAGMTVNYREEDLRAIAASDELMPEIVPALNELLQQESQVYVSKHKLAEQIISGPLAAIQAEKAKYELKANEESVKLRLQMVKGIPYGLWGLNAGVCIAADLDLWNDPNFKLIAMIDEENKSTVGFIHVYEIVIKGKKYWTLPGLEPSVEFIGSVDPAELYEQLMANIILLAQEAGDIQGIYIPTNPIIHSNRSDLQKVIREKIEQAIKDKKGLVKNIPTVNWSRRPAYPFEEVFVAWERE